MTNPPFNTTYLSVIVTRSIAMSAEVVLGRNATVEPSILLRNDIPGNACRGVVIGAFRLSELQRAARSNTSLQLRVAENTSRELAPLGIFQCIEFAQQRQIETLRESIQNQPTPTAVLNINGGAIHQVEANTSMRIIVLDEDTEGSDDQRVTAIEGEEAYVHDFVIEGDAAADRVCQIALAVDDFNAEQMADAGVRER